jgi:hypothetical protein
MSKFHKNGLFTKLRNILLIAILAAWQVAFAGAPLLNSQIANAANNSGNPAANLDQCRNGTLAAPAQCVDSGGSVGWVNGNAGSNDSHWREGDSIAYRMQFSNLTLASHTVTIQWDTTKSGKHAIDYLTTFNRTETTADPCSGVAGCIPPTSTKLIPTDPNAVNQIPGNFTLYNGTINSLSSYTVTGSYAGDSSTAITINFTAGNASPVLAWGGHIATQIDWGAGNSASAVSGSPYHTRLLDLDGSGGNQDRSLAAGAVFPTPTITTQVSSSAINLNQTVTDTATLVGPGTNPAAVTGTVNFFVCGPSGSNPACTTGGSQVGSGVTIAGGQATSSAYSPQAVGNYCFRAEYTPAATAPYSPQNHTNLTTECFAVSPAPSTLTVVKNVVNDNGGTAAASSFAVKVNGTQLTGGTVSNGGLTDTYSVSSPQSGTPYTVSEDSPTAVGYTQTSLVCKDNATQATLTSTVTLSSGQNVTCTITNDDIVPSLTLNKIVSNTHGGAAVESNWTLTATGPTNLSGPGAAGSADVVSGATFKAGTYTLSESGAPTGYSASDWTCTGNVTVTNSQITLANGQTTVCSITNSDIAPILTVVKNVVNPYGTPLSPTAFPLFVDNISVTTNISTTQFNAGTHTVTETQQTGYTLTGVTGDCTQANDTISLTLSIGGSATCTLTNTAIQPKLIVIKHVVNDNNGPKSASDFTMTVTGNSATVPNFAGNEAGVTVGLNEGNYSVDETSHDGYTETKSADCSGTVSIGQTKTCTITNNDIAQRLDLHQWRYGYQ